MVDASVVLVIVSGVLSLRKRLGGKEAVLLARLLFPHLSMARGSLNQTLTAPREKSDCPLLLSAQRQKVKCEISVGVLLSLSL